MRRLVFVARHGETDWNTAGRWQGHTDVPLNENGRAPGSSRVICRARTRRRASSRPSWGSRWLTSSATFASAASGSSRG
jgi:hypothetical protein